MVIHDRFIFVHMVKTGGTFLQDYFSKHIPGCRGTGSGANRHKPASDVKAFPQFKFGVMRNPYSWYVSWWYFQAVQKKPGNSLPTILTKSFTGSIKNIEAAQGIIKQTKSPLFIDFDILHKFDIGVMTYKFIESFCDTRLAYDTLAYEADLGYNFIIDETIGMENLADHLIELFHDNIFELSNKQKEALYRHPKINTTNHNHYTSYYDIETIKWVKHKERHLFHLYPEYEFEFDNVASN